MLFQLFFLPVVQRLGFCVKPLVDLVLRAQLLVNVAGLVHQVQHHAIFHGFAEFVGVDVAAKYFQAGGFVFLEQGRAGEADEHRIGHQRLHHAVELAALCAVAFVHKYKHLTHRGAGLRLQVFDECVKVRIGTFGRRAKLVHQRAQQSGRGLAQLAHQVVAAAGAADGFTGISKHPLDLFVQFIAVGDDGHPRLRLVLQNPFGQ